MAISKRRGQLTDDEVWRAVHVEHINPHAIAAFEGVGRDAIYKRLRNERKRRSEQASAAGVDAARREHAQRKAEAETMDAVPPDPVRMLVQAMEDLARSVAAI